MNNEIKKSPFKFQNYIIAESYIKTAPYDINIEELGIDIKPKGIIHTKESLFELYLSVNVVSKDNYFKASVLVIGLFQFKEIVNSSDLNTYFYTNSPAILYPYVRSYISALTALSGTETINIPPMNMTLIGKQLKENTTEYIKEENQND